MSWKKVTNNGIFIGTDLIEYKILTSNISTKYCHCGNSPDGIRTCIRLFDISTCNHLDLQDTDIILLRLLKQGEYVWKYLEDDVLEKKLFPYQFEYPNLVEILRYYNRTKLWNQRTKI